MMFDYDEYDFEDYDSDELVNKSVSDLLWKIEDSVKKKYEKQIQDLKDELSELKNFRDDYDKYADEMHSLERQLEETKNRIHSEAANMRLKDIIEAASKPCYGISLNSRYVYDKCDKCDNERYIHFNSPSGRDMKEPCKCSEIVFEYSVEPAYLFSINTYDYQDSEIKGINFEHALYSDFIANLKDSDRACVEKRIFYHGQRFDDLTDYQIRLMYFRNKEDAERAAEYLNSKNSKKG